MQNTPIDSSQRSRPSTPRQFYQQQDFGVRETSGPGVAPNDQYSAAVQPMQEQPWQPHRPQYAAGYGAGIDPGSVALTSYSDVPQSNFGGVDQGEHSGHGHLPPSTAESSQTYGAGPQTHHIDLSVASTDLWSILLNPLDGEVRLVLANGTLMLRTPPNEYGTVVHVGSYRPHGGMQVLENIDFVDFAPGQRTLSEEIFGELSDDFSPPDETTVATYDGFDPITLGLSHDGRIVLEDGHHRFAAAMANNVTVDVSLDVQWESSVTPRGTNWSQIRFGPMLPVTPEGD
jgi:hypothetical protein